jgi:hypothetical protein
VHPADKRLSLQDQEAPVGSVGKQIIHTSARRAADIDYESYSVQSSLISSRSIQEISVADNPLTLW